MDRTGYHEIRHLIPHGATLLWRPRPWRLIGRLIAHCGRGPYSHASMAAWNGDRLECLEVLQFQGGNTGYLSDCVRRFPGCIDVYVPNAGNLWPHYDAQRAVAKMREIVGHDKYGYWNLLRVAAFHTPIVRMIVPPVTDDRAIGKFPPFCSQAVALADQHGVVDVVPNLAPRLVEPNDLARSLFYRLLFPRLV